MTAVSPAPPSRLAAPKPHLAAIRRTPHAEETREGMELMDRNERTVDFPPEVVEDLRRLVTPFRLRAYPEPDRFRRKLAAWLGVSREALLLTQGADGALKMIFEVFVNAGDDVVGAWPAFAMYPIYCQMVGARWRPVQFHEDLTLPLDALLERITERTRVVVLANPSQPIERAYDEQEIQRLVETCARHNTLLIMDEAYHYFCPFTALPWVRAYPNLFVVRSFSKAFGVAGLRLGCCVSHPEHITALASVRPIAEAHAVALAVGGYLLDHPELTTSYVSEVKQAMAVLTEACRRLGYEASGRWANWVLVTLPKTLPAPEVAEALRQRGFLIRAESTPPLSNHLRVTAGDREQARRFLAAFEAVVTDRRAQAANR